MTSPALAETIRGLRWYRNPNRHENQLIYRGVTSTCGALPKYAIPHWAARTVAEYAVCYMGSWRDLPAMDALDLLAGIPWKTRDRAGARGNEVHAVIEAILSGERYEVEATVEPWIASARSFIDDFHPEPELMEFTGYAEKTLTAGTADFVGRLRRAPELGRVLVDWKTSKGIFPDMGVQVVGGYAFGFEYLLDDDYRETGWSVPDSCAIVHLTPEGYEVRPVSMDRVYRRAFLAALEIRKWEADAKIGDPLPRPPEPSSAPDTRSRVDSSPAHEWDLVWLRSRIKELELDDQLELSAECNRRGIRTRAADMTVDDVDNLSALISEVERRAGPPAITTRPRPMP